MPLCPQITNTPITVTQTAAFTVTSVVPAIADSKDGLAANLGEVIASSGNQTYRQLTPPTSPPFTLKAGDIWFDTDDGNKEYRWDGTNWISVQDGSIATKNRTYYSGTAPTGSDLVTGDIWFDINTGNKPYRWNGTSWISVQDASIATALSTANAAQTTANGKNKVIYSVSAPSGSGTAAGDIWWQYNASGIITGQWEWSGSSWLPKTIGSQVIANLDAGKITAGTISVAISLEAATITGGSININNGTFVVTNTGAVTITATSGININSGTFQVSSTGAVTASNLTINGGSISLNGGVFSVSTTGVLTASNATITGTINSSNGTIGGWNISSTRLFTGTVSNPSQFLSSSGGALFTGTVSVETLGVAGAATIGGSLSIASTMFAPNLNTSTSATNLRVATGTIGEVTETSASSVRFKENIVNVESVEELDPKKLLSLPVRAFTYKAGYLSENDDRLGTMLPGFIAEEVDVIYPVAADYGQDGPHSWNDRFIIPGLLALIQDLYKEINLLKGE